MPKSRRNCSLLYLVSPIYIWKNSSSEVRSQTARINSEETASCSTETITAYVAIVAEI
jgi:hypothetical protein